MKPTTNLEFIDNKCYVYFIRPTPRTDPEEMNVFLSVAYSEEEAWGYVLKAYPNIGIEKNYYVDDVFLSYAGQPLGLMWGD